MVFLHGSMVIIARGASRNVRIVEKCQNCKNLPIDSIVYFHHGDRGLKLVQLAILARLCK